MVVRDLTDRKRAEREAEAERNRLRELVEQAPVLMATAEGPEHVYTSANRHYLEKLGLRHIVGRRVRDVLPEIEAQGILEILDEIYRTGEPFHATALPMDLDVHGRTTRFYFNLVYQAMRDGEGNVTGILAHVNDVTPQVAANARLERLNAELSAAYDETIEGWARAGPQGRRHGRAQPARDAPGGAAGPAPRRGRRGPRTPASGRPPARHRQDRRAGRDPPERGAVGRPRLARGVAAFERSIVPDLPNANAADDPAVDA